MNALEIKIEEQIAILKIDRAHVLNALNTDLLHSLQKFLLNIPQEIKAIILTGVDKAFIAGADIKEMQHLNTKELEQFLSLGQSVATLLETAPIITLAALNGYALGGGFEMALACDLLFAAPNAKMGFPEATLGLIPGFGGIPRLARCLSPQLAKEMLFSGKILTSSEALQCGLINRICTAEQLLEESKIAIKQILKNSFFALQQSKKAINRFSAIQEALLKEERNAFLACFATADSRTAISEFLNKQRK